MAGPLQGHRGSISIQLPAESTAAPPEKPGSLASEELRARVAVEPPRGGPRKQPPVSRRQQQLNILQNSLMAPGVSSSTARSSGVRTPPPNRKPPLRPSQQTAPVLQQAPASVQAGPTDASVRVMTDREVLTALLESGKHLDLQQTDAVETLTKKLEAHTPNFANMSTKDLAKLSVALRDFGRVRLNDLRGRVDIALARRVEDMALNPPIAEPGATPAGVRAAFVDRLSSLKEDVETLSLLAKSSSNLPAEDRLKRTAAIVKTLPATIAKLADVMWQGTEERSPRIIAKAVELARLAHATLLALNPQEPADLEVFLTTALRTRDSNSLLGAELILTGKVATGDRSGEKPGVLVESNAVSAAINRQADETDTPSNRETRNLQLFGRALGYAVNPASKWSEPTGEGKATTYGLFGDEKTWPTDGVRELKEELSKAKGWPGSNINCCKALLPVLEGIHAIRNAESLTQKEAERLTAPLQKSIIDHAVYEPLGNQKLLYKWNLNSLVTLSPRDRATKLREMLEPARIGVQRRIISEVNAGRFQAETAKLKAAEQTERMARQAEARKVWRNKS